MCDKGNIMTIYLQRRGPVAPHSLKSRWKKKEVHKALTPKHPQGLNEITIKKTQPSKEPAAYRITEFHTCVCIDISSSHSEFDERRGGGTEVVGLCKSPQLFNTAKEPLLHFKYHGALTKMMHVLHPHYSFVSYKSLSHIFPAQPVFHIKSPLNSPSFNAIPHN